MITGRCYCGTTALTASAEPVAVAYCHCTDCRRWTGAPVGAFAAFQSEAVILTPDPGAFSAVAGVDRWVCPACGSPLAARFDYLPGQVYVPLGVLDDAAAFPPAMHAHADACLPWLRIDDDLPRSHGSARETLNAST